MHAELFLLQLAVIVLATRAVGVAFRLIRQPQVVGEIVAGILLGPSVLGTISPKLSAMLFPAESMSVLYVVSLLGLILFMFHIGQEVELETVLQHGRVAAFVSITSMLIPFVLGLALAFWVVPSLAPPAHGRLSFALFIGIAMSITAFPVLARMLEEHNLTKTRVGSLVIACAAFDDLAAWSGLAIIVAIVNTTSIGGLAFNFVALVVYVVVMIVVVRPFLSRCLRMPQLSAAGALSISVVTLLISAVVTEHLGVHALFGAFAAGVVMPRTDSVRRAIRPVIAPISTTLFLPVFFAFTGLRTSLEVIRGTEMWAYVATVLFVAVAGKGLGSLAAARAGGLSWHESAVIGALLNTRGLVELVILNVGYDLGVISREMFSIMVLMAIATTMMTAPLLALLKVNTLAAREEQHSNAAKVAR